MNMRVSSPVPGVLCESKAAKVSVLAAPARLSLRARGDLAPLNAALGLTLPERIGARAASGETETLRLGPDEWTILAPIAETGRLIAACAGIYASHPHSLVDISGREVTLLIDPMSLQYLAGAEIDYQENVEGAQFVIKNPNATSTCGCGSSFSA